MGERECKSGGLRQDFCGKRRCVFVTNDETRRGAARRGMAVQLKKGLGSTQISTPLTV